MSKHHFIAIAKVLKRSRPHPDATWRLAPWHVLVDNMANYLVTTNSQFGRDKFIEACNE